MQSQDEADLIRQAKKQLQLHKQATQKLSRRVGPAAASGWEMRQRRCAMDARAG